MTAQTFELNHCYNMDCMEAMAAFPNDYFDLAVVDPPYFSGPERRGFYGSKVSRIGVHRDYPVSPAWEVPGKEYFDELTRVSRHYIIWGCNYFSYGFAPGRIVWDKCNQATSFSDCEIAATDLLKTIRLFRYKARRVKSLARSVHIGIAPHRGTKKNDVEQCKHTFKITAARCAPCSGYNVECKHYEGKDAADTKHCPR